MEIVKGPASTLYGSEAVGGLINIITKQPLNAPLLATDVFATGWGEVNADIGLKYRIGKNAQSLLGLNYFNYQNPIDNNGDNFTDLTLQNRVSIFNKINFERKNNKLFTLAGRYVYEDRWGGEMDWTKENRGGDQVYGESIYTSRWETFGVYQLPTEVDIRFQYSANGHSQNSVYGTTIYIADQYIGFGQLTWNKDFGKHDLLVGAAYRYTHYDDNTTATLSAKDSSNEASIIQLPGVFAQNEWTLNETNKLLLGFRYDINSIHGSILTPRINYKWNSRDKKNILRREAWAMAIVWPMYSQRPCRSYWRTNGGEFKSELKPETSSNANINFVKKIYTRNNTFIGLDASAFYTYFTNRIMPDYETDPNKIIYDNLDGFSVSKGISVNADLSWKSGLKALAGVTVMDVSVEENGRRFRQLLTESVQGVWSLGYTFSRINLTVDYTGNLYGPMRLPLLGELIEDQNTLRGGAFKTSNSPSNLAHSGKYMVA